MFNVDAHVSLRITGHSPGPGQWCPRRCRLPCVTDWVSWRQRPCPRYLFPGSHNIHTTSAFILHLHAAFDWTTAHSCINAHLNSKIIGVSLLELSPSPLPTNLGLAAILVTLSHTPISATYMDNIYDQNVDDDIQAKCHKVRQNGKKVVEYFLLICSVVSATATTVQNHRHKIVPSVLLSRKTSGDTYCMYTSLLMMQTDVGFSFNNNPQIHCL